MQFKFKKTFMAKSHSHEKKIKCFLKANFSNCVKERNIIN